MDLDLALNLTRLTSPYCNNTTCMHIYTIQKHKHKTDLNTVN